MLRTWIHRIKPGKEAELRNWFATLNARADEVRDSLRAGGIRAEQAFVLSGLSGSLLVYVSDAADQAHAELQFNDSSRPIDAEHRAVMEACIADSLDVAPVYDVTV